MIIIYARRSELESLELWDDLKNLLKKITFLRWLWKF